MTVDDTSRRRQRRLVFSHDGLRRPAAPGETARNGGRWIAGFLAEPGTEPGVILADRPVAAAICHQHHQIRAGYIADLLTRGDAYADALADADSCYPRIHLDGDHLVYDQRHVVGDSDAIISIEPGHDRRYRLGLGARWYRVGPPVATWSTTAPIPTRR